MALFRSKIDVVVAQIQHVNLRIVDEPECISARFKIHALHHAVRQIRHAAVKRFGT